MSSFPDIHAIERSRIVDEKKREKKFLELPYNPSYLATRPGYAGKAQRHLCTYSIKWKWGKYPVFKIFRLERKEFHICINNQFQNRPNI